jgi:glycosyltransferase involved in cell wall biosynthesis
MTEPIDSTTSGTAPARGKQQRFAGKRIGMVVYSSYPYDPRPRRAIDALVAEGAFIDLICLGDDNAPKHEVLNGINVHRVSLKHRRGGKSEYAFRYTAFILITTFLFAVRSLRRRYDMIYVHNMPDILIVSALIPKLFGARAVLDLHDPMPELMMTIFGASPESKTVRLLKRIEKWSIGRANLAITVNVACKRIFSTRSCKLEKIAVVMNSPDERIFPFREPKSSANQESANKPFVIMYHGSLVERNGLDVAVAALERLRDRVPSAQLKIFGKSTPFLESIMESVQKNGLQDRVQFMGSRLLEKLVIEIDGCDLGVIPSHLNAFTEINTPTRIFEYLSQGKPVIAPATSGIQDYFDKDSLLFFEAGNADDLAKQIEYAASHPREMSEIVHRAQKVFLDHTWEREREVLLSRLSETVNS